eukprot:gene7789-9254_t
MPEARLRGGESASSEELGSPPVPAELEGLLSTPVGAQRSPGEVGATVEDDGAGEGGSQEEPARDVRGVEQDGADDEAGRPVEELAHVEDVMVEQGGVDGEAVRPIEAECGAEHGNAVEEAERPVQVSPPGSPTRLTALSPPARGASPARRVGGRSDLGEDGGPPMEACEAPITEDGDPEGEPGRGGRLPSGVAGDLPEAYEAPIVEEGEGGDFAFLSPTALEALLRGSGGEVHMVARDALGRDLSEEELDAVDRGLLWPEQVVRRRGAAYLLDGEVVYHQIARGTLVTPSLHAVFAAGLVGEGGEIMDPVPIIQVMEVEADNITRGGLGVAEAATALPAEVVRAEYVEAAGGAVDRPGYVRDVPLQLSSGAGNSSSEVARQGRLGRPAVREQERQGCAAADAVDGGLGAVGAGLLGRRVRVWWTADETTYAGVVHAWEPGSGLHVVRYDDGEEVSHDLDAEQVEWGSGGPEGGGGDSWSGGQAESPPVAGMPEARLRGGESASSEEGKTTVDTVISRYHQGKLDYRFPTPPGFVHLERS